MRLQGSPEAGCRIEVKPKVPKLGDFLKPVVFKRVRQAFRVGFSEAGGGFCEAGVREFVKQAGGSGEVFW